MSKYLLFICVLVSFTLLIKAQSFKITDENGKDVTNLEIDTFSHPDSSVIGLKFYITNNYSSTLRVKVKKSEADVISGSTNYFCWATQCYTPSVYVSPDFLNMTAGYTTSNTEKLTCDYLPSGKLGTSKIVYTVFNNANPSESDSVVVNYNITLGVENLNYNEIAFSNPYPNPANNKFSIDYNLIANIDAKIILHDILGSQILNKSITESRGTLKFNTSGLANGLYFYSIIINNKTIKTNKIIISK